MHPSPISEAQRRNSLWRRLAGAAAATVLFAAPILWSLQSAGEPDRVETPISPREAGASQNLSFPEVTEEGDRRRHQMWLFSPAPFEVLTHQEIVLHFYQSDHTSPHPAAGRLEFVGTDCAYETAPDAHAENGRAITFTRVGRCRPGQASPNGDIRLTMTVGGPGHLGLYLQAVPDRLRANHLIYVSADTPGAATPPQVVMGTFVDVMPDGGLRRANLLNYAWTGDTQRGPVWPAMALALGLVFGGLLMFPLRVFSAAPDLAAVARGGAAASCLAAALATIYTIVVPPLQGADEPYHLASYGALVDQQDLPANARRWAMRNHSERIKGNAREKLRARNVGQPSPAEPEFRFEVRPDAVVTRSSLAAHFWRLVHWVLPETSVQRLFLSVRLAHAGLFALVVGLSTAAFLRLVPVPFPQLLAIPFLIVPALPFFATHFGESALIASASVVFASVLTILFLSQAHGYLMGLPLGVTTAVFLVGTRNSLPLLLLVAFTLVGRAILGDGSASKRRAFVFWWPFGIATSSAFLIASEPQLANIGAMLSQVGGRIDPSFGNALAAAVTPWTAVLVALIGSLAEIALQPLRAVGPRLRPIVQWVGPVALLALAVGVVVSLVGSLWLTYPRVDTIQGAVKPPLGAYLSDLAWTMGTTFRLNQHSMLLSSSFWVGFGWLDTMPPPWFSSALLTVTALSLIALCLSLARSRNVHQMLWLGVFALGAILTFGLYGVSAYQLPVNLHGRYLIGWYLSVVAIFWAGPAVVAPRGKTAGATAPRLRPAATLALALAIHGYSVWFILQRYF